MKIILWVIGGWLVLSVATTVLSLHAVSTSNFSQAEQLAQLAKPGSYLPDIVSFNRFQETKLWPIGLDGITFIPKAIDVATAISLRYNQTGVISLADADEMLAEGITILERLRGALPISSTNPFIQVARHHTDQLLALSRLAELLATTDVRTLLLIQGPDELRPTGGFMGAYTIAEWRAGSSGNLQFEDIYDAAGQFDSEHTPPPGVQEFLSGGEGWNLPDANWSPHFPATAQTMGVMMEQANKGHFDVIISVNTTLLKDLLGVTGPIPLPEYQTELSQSTVDDLLADHRKEYFPGSRAKANLLAQAVPHLIRAIGSLDTAKQLALARLLLDALDEKEIQIWSEQTDLQSALEQAQMAGSLNLSEGMASTATGSWSSASQAELFGIVEANVGINKINPFISRTYQIENQENELRFTITWQNSAQPGEDALADVNPERNGTESIGEKAPEASHSAYVNYVRLLTTDKMSLINSRGGAVTQGASTPLSTDSAIVTPANMPPTHLHQTPFLIVVRPGESVSHTFVLSLPSEDQSIVLWKQSGLPAILTEFSRPGATDSFGLRTDTLLISE